MYATKGRLFLVSLFFSLLLIPSKSFAQCNVGDFEMGSGIEYGGGSDTGAVGGNTFDFTMQTVCDKARAAAKADVHAKINNTCFDIVPLGYHTATYKAEMGIHSHVVDPAPGGTISCNIGIEKKYSCCTGTLPIDIAPPPAATPTPPPVLTPPPAPPAPPAITPVMPPMP